MYVQVLALVLGVRAAASEPLPPDPVVSWALGAIESETVRLCFESGPPGAFRRGADVSFPRPFDIPASVASINAADYPVRFRVLTVGKRTVVVPLEVADEDGRYHSQSPVLDTPIDLGPPEPAAFDVVLERFVAALASATGQTVALGESPRSSRTCDVSGQGNARDLLAAILDCRGDYDVWWMGSTSEGYALRIIHLFGMDETPVYRPDLPFEEWNRPPREVEAKYPLFPR